MVCILATLIVPTHAYAEPALPRTTQERLLKSLDPLRPGVLVESPWKIGNITIERSQIRIELGDGEQTSSLLLVHRGTATDTSLTTKSFAVQLAPDAPKSQAFIASVERITSLISQGDDGSYFIQIETPREEERPGGGNDLDIGWVLSLLLLLGFALVMRRPGRDLLRLDLPVALALMAVAFALRVTLGPMTFLHENAHGVHFRTSRGIEFHRTPNGRTNCTRAIYHLLGYANPRRTYDGFCARRLVTSIHRVLHRSQSPHQENPCWHRRTPGGHPPDFGPNDRFRGGIWSSDNMSYAWGLIRCSGAGSYPVEP